MIVIDSTIKAVTLLVVLAFWGSMARSQTCPSLPIDSVSLIGPDSARVHFSDELDPDISGIQISFVVDGMSADGGVISSHGITSPASIQLPVPGTSYELYSRALCGSADMSDWLGPYHGITAITDSINCGLAIEIPDDGCPGTTDVPIYVEAGSATLGVDVSIAELRLTIDHNWPPDVNVWLSNPSGVQMQIFTDLTVGGDDFGNPADPTCSEYVSFAPDACASIDTARPPYIGQYRPMEDFSLLYDSSSATGLWTIHLCDDGELLTGELVYAEILLSPITCSQVHNPMVQNLGETSADVSWTQLGDCDSVIIEVGPTGFINNYTGNNGGPGGAIYNIPCGENVASITGLTASMSYELYFYTWCDGTLIQASCAQEFTTLCNELSFLMDFEAADLCDPSCLSSCDFSGVFKNSLEDDFDWTVWSGSTPSPGTGATSGAAGSFQYIYTESSTLDCQGNQEAILISDCLLVEPSSGQCHLSLSAHMQGRDIGRLEIAALLDTADTWDVLLLVDSSQGSEWISYEINLDDYAGEFIQLRISSALASGARGDICIDEIRLYDVNIVDEADQLYYRDADGDGYGRDDVTLSACRVTAPEGFTDQGGDCDDDDPTINPAASEITCNQIDENCNGMDDDFAPSIAFAVDTIEIEHPSCQGNDDGMLEVIIDTIADALTYSWSTGQSGPELQDLAAGSFSVTITDDDGCALELSDIRLEATDFIDYDITRRIIPSCQGQNNGSISIRPFGGNAPYTVLWDHGAVGQDLTDIGAGRYRATIMDEDSCQVQTDYIELRAPELVLLRLEEARFTTCGDDSSGLLDISVVQGVPPYDYAWNHGEITDRVEKLLAGSYVCTVTDARGCTGITDTFHIGRSDTLEVRVTGIEMPTCAGMQNGQISLSGVGGAGPYTALWDDGDLRLSRDDLAAGSYHVTLTDANGCMVVEEDLILTEPDSLALHIDLTDVTCRGSADGQVSIEIIGGTPDYQIFWSNGRVNRETISGLDAGIYSVTVSDASGCKALSPTLSLIEKNDPLDLQAVAVQGVRCPGGQDGVIEIELQSGTAPYIYNWSNGRLDTLDIPTDAQSDLLPGSYDVTVTDDRGCVGVLEDIMVEAKDPIIFHVINVLHPACVGSTDGSIEVDITGGTPAYEVLWNDGVISDKRDDLPMGTYFFDITDANDCEVDGDFLTLTDPDGFAITTSSQAQTGSAENGIARVNVRGATPPYTIIWDDNARGQMGPAATGLAAGKYAVTITDHRECSTDTCVTVELLNNTSQFDLNEIEVYPNPAQSYLWVEWDDLPTQRIRLQLVDLIGQLHVPRYTLDSGKIQVELEGYAPGIYLLEIYEDKKLLGVEKVIKH